MSKENATAASMAHKPEEQGNALQPHAVNYPGVNATKKIKASDGSAPHEQSTMESGRKMSLGTSANGSHKGLPVKYEYVGHKSGVAGKDEPLGFKPSPESIAHNAGELAAGRKNSMGVSADGSHKGIPTSMEHAGQR